MRDKWAAADIEAKLEPAVREVLRHVDSLAGATGEASVLFVKLGALGAIIDELDEYDERIGQRKLAVGAWADLLQAIVRANPLHEVEKQPRCGAGYWRCGRSAKWVSTLAPEVRCKQHAEKARATGAARLRADTAKQIFGGDGRYDAYAGAPEIGVARAVAEALDLELDEKYRA